MPARSIFPIPRLLDYNVLRVPRSCTIAYPEPGDSDTPVFTPESIRVVAAATSGEMIDAEHATRNVLADLEADRPYIFTHFVHDAPIRERFDVLLQALERARR
jgi:hypothetical protein